MNQVDNQHGGTARPPTMQTALPDKPKPKTSGMAIASVICGALGACTFITSIIGVILGIVALNKIKNSNGEKSGQGIAIAGIVVSCVTLIVFFFVAMMAGIMLPALGKARQSARGVKMQAEARITVTDFAMYSVDYGSYPPADDWYNALNEMYAKGGTTAWIPDYLAMNSALSGLHEDDVTDPSLTVLLFEIAPGSAIVGGPELLAPEPQRSSGHMIVFVDGGIHFVPTQELDTLVWEP